MAMDSAPFPGKAQVDFARPMRRFWLISGVSAGQYLDSQRFFSARASWGGAPNDDRAFKDIVRVFRFLPFLCHIYFA